MNNLLVKMEIPFLAYPDATSDTAMIFHKWLPIDEENFINVESDNLKLKLWFDTKTSSWISPVAEEEISKWVNIPVQKIYADVIVSNLGKDLLKFISTRNYSEKIKPEEEDLQKDYEVLGRRIQEFTLNNLNRLIAYVRVYKGQYWLQEHPTDGEYSAKFSAKAKLDDEDWFVWQPTNVHTIKVVLSKKYGRYLDETDWGVVKDFVRSSRKTELHWYLLAGAEALASKNNNRAALTEAVTALEVAINYFSSDRNISSIFGEKLSERMGVNRLEKQVEHMGLTGTIQYLFPVLFTEEQVPSTVLKVCQEALDIRGNVVHGGQREIEDSKLKKLINGIRQLCEILERFKVTIE